MRAIRSKILRARGARGRTQAIVMTCATLLVCALRAAAAPVPTVFAPGVISGPASDMTPAFSPDGRTVYFTRSNNEDYVILESHLQGSRWSEPEVAPFSGQWRDLEPAFAPDGSFLVFASSRPREEGGKPVDGSWGGKSWPGRGGNLWRVERQGAGWGQPVRLPDTVNRSTSIFSPAVTRDGSLYFMDPDSDSGRFQIYRSQLTAGVYQPAERLPWSAAAWSNVDVAVAPDESFVVVCSSRPPAEKSLDLFIIFHRDGRWAEPIHLNAQDNSPISGIEARLGPDGHTLFYSTDKATPRTAPHTPQEMREILRRMRDWDNGLMNIWQVDLSSWLKAPQQPAAAAGHE
jgi:hypothetical protein